MRQIMDVNGGVLHSEREYDIEKETVIHAGAAVKLVEGCVVPVAAGETGSILGYAAESHAGADDVFNPRARGTKIMVQDAPAAVAESPAPVVLASGGTDTTVTVDGMAAFKANDFKGGFVKGADGHIRRITASSVASGVLTLTVERGATPVVGEAYIVFPPNGFAGGNLDGARSKLVLTATAALPIQVMGRDEINNKIWTVATKHILAAAR